MKLLNVSGRFVVAVGGGGGGGVGTGTGNES
jgi:hypothetical protein